MPSTIVWYIYNHWWGKVSRVRVYFMSSWYISREWNYKPASSWSAACETAGLQRKVVFLSPQQSAAEPGSWGKGLLWWFPGQIWISIFAESLTRALHPVCVQTHLLSHSGDSAKRVTNTSITALTPISAGKIMTSVFSSFQLLPPSPPTWWLCNPSLTCNAIQFLNVHFGNATTASVMLLLIE